MIAQPRLALPLAGPARLRVVALALFDQTAAAHQLPESSRPLLALAADAYTAAVLGDAKNPARSARDTILAAPLPGVSASERAIAACAAIFLREKLRSHRETAFVRLGQRNRGRAQCLAATLQLADAIAQSPAVALAARVDLNETALLVEGPGCAAAAQAVSERGELWREAVGPLAVVGGEAGETGEAGAPGACEAHDLAGHQLDAAPEQLSGDELAGEGARRILRRFFERMLAREDDVRRGEDAEDVHQMRVATRRLRASLQVAAMLFAPEPVLRFRRGLRRAARALGDVRDWDVFLGDLRARAAALTDADAALLEPLIEAAGTVRAAARARLLHDLDAGRYARFKHEFAVFLTTPGAALAALPTSGAPPLVRDVAGSTIWQRYEQWRAFEAALPAADDLLLHQARIAGKRLRYTLEFFAEALGPRTDKLLDQLADLQEHLGHIQDAAAARAHIATLGMHEDPGAQAYLAQLESARAELLATLPQVWGKVGGEPYRRRLMELLVKL